MSSSNSSPESSPGRHARIGRRARKDPQTPQQKIDEFWAKHKTKAPGKATSIIPQNEFAERAARRASAKCAAPAKTTEQSYAAAAEQCRRKVAQIVKECRRVNQKYRDPHFDLEIDQKLSRRDCLDSLDNERDDPRPYWFGGRGARGGRSARRRRLPHKDRDDRDDRDDGTATAAAGGILGLLGAVDREAAGAAPPDGDGENAFRPQAVKRVVDIFDDPQFFIDGPTANDVRQGRDGDCWLMAALCTLSNKPGLIERCCVAHDQEVGVYGFVFHRDGEWFSEIIDDKLYLTKPDYDESLFERILWEDRERVNSEEAYRKIYQSNSGSLYFAQCEHPQETWLPLLEKAYAKAHGDYSAIEGGYGGEGIEDLTGGVTSEIYTTDILDKEHFWNEELMKVNQDFLFGCSTGVWGRGWGERKGIVELHAYSVLKAREIDGVRLVLLKNPWGKHEWKGPWSDGSKEWTAEWLQKLDHKFGDDGSFWISYEDLLKKYQAFDRTRLFGPEWKVASIWTTLNVSWTLDYHDTKFVFSLARSGPVVIVFSQLDERYFKGLEGQYRFELSFRVHRRAAGEDESSDYVVRSQSYYRMNRSVNVELDLDAGEYVVVVKVDAQRNERLMPVEEVVRAHARDRREKLQRIGLAYDLAHSKGKILETPEEREAREAYERRKGERERRRMARRIRENRQEAREAALRQKRRERKAREKAEARAKAKAERKAARREARRKAEEEEKEREEKEKAEAESKEQADDGEKKEGKEGEDTGGKESPSRETPVVVEEDKKLEDAQIVTDTKSDDVSTETPQDEKPTDEKPIKTDVPPEADIHAEGSTSSAEAGENTPASSAASTKEPAEGEDPRGEEEEAYVTAVEEDTEDKKTTPAAEESPPTPKPAQPPTAVVPKTESAPPARVDVGVQTGPQLPPPPVRRGPPPPGMYSPQPMPPPHPGAMLRYGGPRGGPPPPPPPQRGPDLSHVPPHLRAAYLRAGGAGGAAALSETEAASTSDSELEDPDGPGGGGGADDVSEVSEHDIDACLAADRARAARAAAAAAAAAAASSGGKAGAAGPGAPGSAASADEPLDEFEKDPWNAVGVFGVRVYYKIPEAGGGEGGEGKEGEEEVVVRLRVERPSPWEDSSDEEADDERDGGKDDGKGEKEESKMLDVDDSAKDAVGEQPPTPSPEGPVKDEEESKEGETKKEVEEERKEEAEGEAKEEAKEEEGKDMPNGNVKTEEDAVVEVKTQGEPSGGGSTDTDVKKEEGGEGQNAA